MLFELTPSPLTVTVALRLLVEVLALVAVTVTVPSPDPLPGDTLSHEASSLTVQLTLDSMSKLDWLFEEEDKLRLDFETFK